MRRAYRYIPMLTVTMLLCCLGSWGECDTELIEKLDVLSIVNMEMYPDGETGGYYIDVTISIENANDHALKFRDNEFHFFLGESLASSQPTYIGPDTAYANKDFVLEPHSLTDMTFSIRTGTQQLTDLETGIQVLNFIGTPAKGHYIFIEGRTTLGVQLDKGWSYGEAVRIEWMLCPRLKTELPLHECLYEVPETAPTAPVSIACDQLVRVGRNIVMPRTDRYIAEMGTASGTFQFSHESYTEPDRIVIEYEGEVLYDTGCVGASGLHELTYTGTATTLEVTVYSRCAFVGPSCTDWDFTIHCPQTTD